MMFRNSVRLLLTNFSTVWKILLYYAICVFVTAAIFVPILSPIISKMTAAGVFADMSTLFNSFFSQPSSVIPGINDIFSKIGEVITTNANAFLGNYICIGIMVFLVIPFIFGLPDLAISETLYGFMSSQTSYGFFACFIKNLGKSSLLQLTRLITTVPLNIIITAILVGIIKLFTLGGFVNVICAFFIFIMFLALVAAKIAYFLAWVPAIVTKDVGPFKALKLCHKATCRNYWKVFSTCILLVIIAFVFNFFFGIFSLGAALFITIPMTVFMFAIFGMVEYYGSMGMRYYVYPDMFVSTKRIEEQEGIKKTKYLL